MEPTPFWDRNDVNAVAFLILLFIVIFGMTLVPPEYLQASK